MPKSFFSPNGLLRFAGPLFLSVIFGALLSCGELVAFGDSVDLSRVSRAKAMLQKLYPELSGKNYGNRVMWDGSYDSEVSLRNFSIIIWKINRILNTEKHTPPPTLPRPEERILTASFEFDSHDVLDSFHASSSDVLSDARMENLRKTVDQHQKWTDAQAEAALRAAGAKYAPSERDTLLQAIPREALEPQLGRFKIDSAEFRTRHKQPSGYMAELYWEVSVSSEFPDGRLLHWSMTFEPFAGKLTSIVRYASDR